MAACGYASPPSTPLLQPPPILLTARLPMEVVLRVLESACISESYEQYYGLDPPASAKRERKLKKRYKDLKAFMLVCRDWYGTVMPRFWSHATFFDHQASLDQFTKSLTQRSSIYPDPLHPRWHRFGCYVQKLDFTFVNSDSNIRLSLLSMLQHCPKLTSIFFGLPPPATPSNSWSSLASYLHRPHLATILGVSLPSLPSSRTDTLALISALNDLPQLISLSCRSLSLQADLSLSLLEVFKMNCVLLNHWNGLRGEGVTSLCFGRGCDLTWGFVGAIPRVCTGLKSFHLLAGANIQSPATIDLDTFITSFPSSLRSFTFLADATLIFNSSYDRILESQPLLSYLHLRSDFISLDFFLRTLPGVLLSLHLDLTPILRADGGISTTLSLPSCQSITASVKVAKEFRRQGLGWTMATQGGVRAVVLKRLVRLSLRGEMEEIRGEEGECGCSDKEGNGGREEDESEDDF